MSMTTVAAKTYVARILGGESSQEALDMAGESILRGYQDWEAMRFWRFLLKDTSGSASVAVQSFPASTTINASPAGTLDFLNVGQPVTYVGVNNALPDGTTVATVTRNPDGTVFSVDLSQAFAGVGLETGTLTVTTGNIPIRQGINDYALPTDFAAAYTARLLTTNITLVWRDPRYWDRTVLPTAPGTPTSYTTYNPQSESTQNFGTSRLCFDCTPAAADTLFLRYYRRFVTTGTNVDMPDNYLYQFLDYCRNILLQTKLAQDNPAAYAALAHAGSEGARVADNDTTEDDDADSAMKSQYEMGSWGRPLWSNGQFDPYHS